MKKTSIITILTALLHLAGATHLSAEDAFLARLEKAFLGVGFQARETELLMTAAREWNWQECNPDFADVAALALSACNRVHTESEAREQIELAYHLAAVNREMHALGFTRRQIARIALNVSRDVAERFRAHTTAENGVGRRAMIHERIRAELCNEGLVSQELKIMERIRAHVRQNTEEMRKKGAPH